MKKRPSVGTMRISVPFDPEMQRWLREYMDYVRAKEGVSVSRVWAILAILGRGFVDAKAERGR